MTYRTRFAPSPNGPLHVGHAYSALTVAARARIMNGVWLLRHEDIDTRRCPPENARRIEADLHWLGLHWHGPALYQSTRLDQHRTALARLRDMGLLYPCFATRGEIRAAVAKRGADWPCDPDGSPRYPGLYKTLAEEDRRARIAAGQPYALRLDMDRALARVGPLHYQENGAGPAGETGCLRATPEVWGDVVLGRKDIGVSYHIAVTVDDALDGITEVVRGRDLFAATGLHRLLQALLDLPEPSYYHHALVRDAAGHKLSKSEGAVALAAWRAAGRTPGELIARLAARHGHDILDPAVQRA